jgi:hypothetical protein
LERKFWEGYLAIFENVFRKEEIDGRDLIEKIDEIPPAIRSREVASRLSPSL